MLVQTSPGSMSDVWEPEQSDEKWAKEQEIYGGNFDTIVHTDPETASDSVFHHLVKESAVTPGD